MNKMELEVKVLNINEKDIIERIENLGGKFVEKSNQYLYTYDLPTIYGRYIDILTQLNNPESEMKKEVAISKLELLFFEIDNLLNEEEKAELKDIIKVNTIIENSIDLTRGLYDEKNKSCGRHLHVNYECRGYAF